MYTGNLLHILASLFDGPELRVSEDLKWPPSGHMDVTVHCCSSLVGEGEPLLDTSKSCQMGQFDPMFVLHQTWTITTSERVTDNESVKSMSSCSILYVAMGSTRQNDKMFEKNSFQNAFHPGVCLP